MKKPNLPKDFIIGTATASYQVEGAGRIDGRTPCIWDEFSKIPGAVYKKQDGDVAVDQYHHYKEDIALMAKLGFHSYRFSVSWTRVLPNDGDTVNEKGIQYYRNICEELHRYGMKACCTIYHWDLPVELQRTGGWANRDTAYRLARFAKILYRELGDLVDMWITINEAKCVTQLGYLTGVHAPGIRDYDTFIKTVHHINLAHGLMVEEYRKTGLTAPIGITHNLEVPRPATRFEKDRIACAHHTAVNSEVFMGPLFKKQYPQYVTEELKWDLPIEEGDMDLISQPIDFLGINYYNEDAVCWSDTNMFNVEFAPRFEDVTTGIGWPVTPYGLKRLLHWANDFTGGSLPIYITETGAACKDTLTRDGRVHDTQRIDYLATTMQMCEELIEEGVPLKGLFCWSFIDNYEWSYGYSKRFGIVYCDYETLKRYPKDSAYYLRDVLAGYGDY